MKANKKRGRSPKPNPQLTAPPTRATERPPAFKKPTSRLTAVALAALLCVLAVAAYANSIGNGFVWDDHQQVVMNASLHPSASLLNLLAPNNWAFARAGVRERINYYRPLQMVTYRLTADVFGIDGVAFHAVNLAFHTIVVLLEFAMFYTLTGRTGLAFASAAIFAVHPIHSEAVDWVAALPDIGCTAFFLLAFWFFIIGRGRLSLPLPTKPSPRLRALFFAGSFASFAAALLWKETAIVFPLIVMAYVFSLSEDTSLVRRIRGTLKVSLPYWFILGLYFLFRLRVLGFIVIRQRNWILSRYQAGLTILNLISEYCWKLIAPIGLNAYHVFVPARTLLNPRAIAAVLFVFLAFGGILYGLRHAPSASFAALWVFITLIPVLDVYAVGRNVFCERYLYLPSVGFCPLIVLAAMRVGRLFPERFRSPAAAVMLAAILLFFTASTFARNAVWKDDSALFMRTLESSPNAPFVHDMVAALQPNNSTGQALAESHYLSAISLAKSEMPPDRSEMANAWKGLASIYAARADFERALRALAEVRIADLNDPQVDGEEGLILTQAGRWTEAEASLRRAVAISPNDANVLNALGLLAWQHDGHLDEAASYFSEALDFHTEADDFNASLHSNLGAVYGQQGRFSDAIAQFEVAVQITPRDPEYLTNLATAFQAVGRIDDARRTLRAALAAAPNYQPARVALGQIGIN